MYSAVEQSQIRFGYSPHGMDIDRSNALRGGAEAGFANSTGVSARCAAAHRCRAALSRLDSIRPGSHFRNVQDSGSADSLLRLVDQFDTLGLSKNTPIITGTHSPLHLNGKFVVLRVPYRWGLRERDGRTDDPAGWKGKGVHNVELTPFHSELARGQPWCSLPDSSSAGGLDGITATARG